MSDLSKNEKVAKEILPATTREIQDAMDISASYARTLTYQLRRKGVPVEQDNNGRYYVAGEDDPGGPASTTEPRRMDSGTKASYTRKIRKFLGEMEHELKSTLNEMEPAVADGGLERSRDGMDLILHRTDDHFGQEETNQYGEVTFDSEMAESRVIEYFDKSVAAAESWQDMGRTIDNVNLLLGGDIVTNESIYDGQAHEIDENLYEQINRAADVYIQQIKRLAAKYPTVQIVCQAGNHGEIRSSGSSTAANADDILYAMMDKVIRESDLDNVTFIQSDSTYYVNFSLRDWNAHLRHGHDASLEHIGTSAGKQRWLSWLVDHGFDVAFRGHYHMYKEEPINGVPVVMGGSIVPQSDFEESRAISGRAMGAVHGATDEYPLQYTRRVTFE